jgi:serine/threonine protein phosphatase PrpC
MSHDIKIDVPIQVAAGSDPGCVRSDNQDSFGYDSGAGIFVLCDGMGGEAAGQVASDLGVSGVLSFLRGNAKKFNGDGYDLAGNDASEAAKALGQALHVANHAIRDAADADASRHGMGTTIVAGLLQGTTLSIAHVGDSRIYLIRNNTIEQLTKDHSLVMEQVRRGLMTLEEAAQSPMQNVITRALGVSESVEPDLADHELFAQDLLLFCSDGLTRHVSDAQILAVISKASSLQAACDDLIASANAAGGSDNITCLLVRFAPEA